MKKMKMFISIILRVLKDGQMIRALGTYSALTCSIEYNLTKLIALRY